MSDDFIQDFNRIRPNGIYSDIRSANAHIKHWTRLQSKKQNAVFGDPDLGIPTGRIVEIFGSESHGKTALLYHLLGRCQRAGGLAVLADVEGSYREDWAKKCGLSTERLLHLRVGPQVVINKKGNTEIVDDGLEGLFNSFHTVITTAREESLDIPIWVGWDSVAATPSQQELTGEYEDSLIATQARALSSCLRKFNADLIGSTVTLLALNQVRTRIGRISYDESVGGRALKFYAGVRVKVVRTSKRTGGIKGLVRNMKNKYSPPFREAQFQISNEEGFAWAKPRAKKNEKE